MKPFDLLAYLKAHPVVKCNLEPYDIENLYRELRQSYRYNASYRYKYGFFIGELTMVSFPMPLQDLYDECIYDERSRRFVPPKYETLSEFARRELPVLTAFVDDDDDTFHIVINSPLARVEALGCPFPGATFSPLGGAKIKDRMYCNHPNLYDTDGVLIRGMYPDYTGDDAARIVSTLRRRKFLMLLGRTLPEPIDSDYVGWYSAADVKQLALAC